MGSGDVDGCIRYATLHCISDIGSFLLLIPFSSQLSAPSEDAEPYPARRRDFLCEDSFPGLQYAHSKP